MTGKGKGGKRQGNRERKASGEVQRKVERIAQEGEETEVR